VKGICRQLEEVVQRYNSKLNSMYAVRKKCGDIQRMQERRWKENLVIRK